MRLLRLSFAKKIITAAFVCGALLSTGGFELRRPLAATAPPPVISSKNIEVNESSGTAVFVITLTGYNPSEVIVYYATGDQSATAPKDYISEKDSITFERTSQSTTQSIDVPIQVINDKEEEPKEKFLLRLSTSSEFVGLPQSTYTATIRANDVPPPPDVPPPTPTPTPTPEPTTDPTPEPEPEEPTEPEEEEPQVLSGTTPSPTPTPPQTPQEEPQRPDFVKSVSDPTEVSTDLAFIAQNLLLALLLILLIAFPADMFNSTLLSHYEEITGWFGAGTWLDRHRKRLAKIPAAFILGSFAALAAAIYGFLSPDFGWNRTSLVLFVGMFLTMIIVSVVYDVFRSYYMRRRFGIQSRLRSQTTGLAMASVMVLASRLANFLPGYLYGVFTALVFTKKNPSEKQDGEGLAVATVVLGLLALGAWFAWIPIKSLATAESPSTIFLILDVVLASLWVAGLGVIVFGLAPLRFFYGEVVKKWNNKAWWLIYATGMVLFVHTVLHPSRGFYGKSDKTSLVAVLSLFIGFGIFSLIFWSYFRYRHLWRHTPDAPTELS